MEQYNKGCAMIYVFDSALKEIAFGKSDFVIEYGRKIHNVLSEDMRARGISWPEYKQLDDAVDLTPHANELFAELLEWIKKEVAAGRHEEIKSWYNGEYKGYW